MYCTSFLLVELVFWTPVISEAEIRIPLHGGVGVLVVIHFTATAFKRNLILGDDQHECTRRGSTLTSLTVVGLLYTSIMRHAHEPNCLLTYYAVLRPFQSLLFLVLSQEGY